MSDLQAFAAHARTMSTAEHKPNCPPRDRVKLWINEWSEEEGCWGGYEKPAKCFGCVTDSDRALWTRLADETDAYLSRFQDDSLFGADA
jgi:hypothetical protein